MKNNNSDLMTTSAMLKEFEKIWPDGKNSTLYELIEDKDKYVEQNNHRFEELFQEAINCYESEMERWEEYGCNPLPDEIRSMFIDKVSDAIFECFTQNRRDFINVVTKGLNDSELFYLPLLNIIKKIYNKKKPLEIDPATGIAF